MANNEVIINGETVLTVRDTTATASDVLSGKVFTAKDGRKVTGILPSGGELMNFNEGLLVVGIPNNHYSATMLWSDDSSVISEMSTLITNGYTSNLTNNTIKFIDHCPKYLAVTGLEDGGRNISYTFTSSSDFSASEITINFSANKAVDLYALGLSLHSQLVIFFGTTCLIEGTLITLADGSTKPIELIDYTDDVLCWDFYNNKLASSKPRYIKIKQTTNNYNELTFSNGIKLGLVGEHGFHRIFNKESGRFTLTGLEETPIGTTTYTLKNGYQQLISQKIIHKKVNFYNVILFDHYNLFANEILTGSGMENRYKIEDMKYVGERLNTNEQIEANFKKLQILKNDNT